MRSCAVCGMICSACSQHLKKKNSCPGCASDEPGKMEVLVSRR